jgi:uncharacterized protein (TIGR02284 family)
MTTPEDKVTAVLSDLIALDFDAVEAYEQAIQRLADEPAKKELARFRGDHERHIRELSAVVKQRGAEPPAQGSFKRFLTQGKVVLASIVGDDGILKAMKSNEDTTNQKYAESLATAGLKPELVKLLEKNLEDERRHRVWLEGRIAKGREAA